MSDLIKREDVMALWEKYNYEIATKAIEFDKALKEIPSAKTEVGYSECADAMLRMWIDNVLTDAEYSRIMDKLNKTWKRT